MNFRANAEMLVLFPRRQLATFRDNSMPRRDWSRFDSPPDEVRKAKVARMKLEGIRRE